MPTDNFDSPVARRSFLTRFGVGMTVLGSGLAAGTEVANAQSASSFRPARHAQDDWMDNDEQRRGGLSTYAAMLQKYPDPGLGASLTILASDVAVAFALELLHETSFPSGRTREALGMFNALAAHASGSPPGSLTT